MKALRLHNNGELRLHEEAQPVPGPGDVLLRVTAVGICGSDLHWVTGSGTTAAVLDKPLVVGHEFAGVVESGDLAGRRVAVDPAIACGECEHCLEGNPNLCLNLRFAGPEAEDGALREYMAWPEKTLYPLPDALTDIDGVMLEPLGVAVHAVDLGHLRTAMTVGVFGLGPVGLLMMQVARAAGATCIVATEKLPHRLEAARALGANHVFQADGGREVDEILKVTGGKGVDVAFEVCNDNSGVEAAIGAVKAGGTVVLTGIPGDNRTSFTAAVARRKGLTFRMTRRMKHAYPRSIRLVENGLVDVRSLVTHRFPLAQYEQAFAVARRREGIKVIIEL